MNEMYTQVHMIQGPAIVDKICSLLEETMKNTGSAGYVVGVSGGVDSALVATLCCRAVGPSRVLGIFLPSAVTPPKDYEDVRTLGEKLSMRVETVPISPIINQYRSTPGFIETPYLMGNLMARSRMTYLYYAANRDSCLVCGTSNRTEFLLGYCTKHGDNAADIQPIIHLLKTDIWDLSRYLEVPKEIIDRAPTAGLWHGQTDEGELGHTYAEIDQAIMSLDMNGWVAQNFIEEKVVAKRKAALHKQMPAPSLL
jgi:NAD+ synthase